MYLCILVTLEVVNFYVQSTIVAVFLEVSFLDREDIKGPHSKTCDLHLRGLWLYLPSFIIKTVTHNEHPPRAFQV